MQCAPGAFAAQGNASNPAADQRAATRPTTQPARKLKPKTAKPPRKHHHKARTARSPNVFYRWSVEQLMLGGVDPSQIGRPADDAGAQSAKKSAASKE